VLALLTWVASCDGTIEDRELDLLRMIAAAVPGGEAVLPAVIDVARLGRPDDLEFACRYLRNHAGRTERPLLAQLFVTMAVQDGHLTVAENHVLRFLADLLGLSARKFAKLFEQVTQRPFPEVGDVSSLEWWRRREAGEQAQAPADRWGTEKGTSSGPTSTAADAASPPPAAGARMTRETALRMFGLDAGAPKDVIHDVYRRLAKARHPDRFARLGPAAQATATAAFTRLQEAYALLSA
jgi:DnaJ like chaperone protein